MPYVSSLVSGLKADPRGNGTAVVTITGHSLGAAIATVFASVVRVVFPDINLHIVTFGTPRIGSPTWVSNIQDSSGTQVAATEIMRIVNRDDVITLVPTFVGAGDSVMHEGLQTTLAWDTVPSNCTGMVDITSELSLVGWIGCAVNSISNSHLNYRPYMNAFLQAQGLPQGTEQWCRADVSLLEGDKNPRI